jgi:PAS domain S-box-containing protein
MRVRGQRVISASTRLDGGRTLVPQLLTRAQPQWLDAYFDIIEGMYDSLIITNGQGVIQDCTPRAEHVIGCARKALVGQPLSAFIDGFGSDFLETVSGHLEDRRRLIVESECSRADGTRIGLEATVSTVTVDGQAALCFFLRNISRRQAMETELRSSRDQLQEAHERLQQNQSQLLQSEKLASLGQLAAGIAHEINNPIAFISSNLGVLSGYLDTVREALDGAAAAQPDTSAREAIEEVSADLVALVSESQEGLRRVVEIVQDLKSFARVDEAELKEADLNACIDITLRLLSNELKYTCEIVRDYGELPPLMCRPGKLNQLFMNVLLNACQSIDGHGLISICTRCDGKAAVITVSDDGCGISEDLLDKVFGPFFTTKPVGEGTGLGLSIAHEIVREHGGSIELESSEGAGTTVTIRLPIGPIQ